MTKLRLIASHGFTVAKLLKVKELLDNAVCDKCNVKFVDGFPACECWLRVIGPNGEECTNAANEYVQELFDA